MAEIQSITEQVSCMHESSEEPLAGKSVVNMTTAKRELTSDESVGSSPVKVSRVVEVDCKYDGSEAVIQDASCTSVIAGKHIVLETFLIFTKFCASVSA